MKTTLLAATPLLAALAWTAAIIVDSTPYGNVPAFLIGFGLLTMSTVATVGMIVVGGRWAHRLGLVTIGLMAILAVLKPIDAVWVAATIITALALVAMLSPGLTSAIRKLASATGPPPRAVISPLLLLAAPTALGLVGNEAGPWALMVVGLSAPGVALLFSRVIPGGLLAVRLVWPALAIALTPLLGLVAGIVAGGLAVAVAVVSWDPSVKASYHPPREMGTAFPIPPELTPPDVLDAAEIDETGRPR